MLVEDLVTVSERRGLGRRTPTRRGWRWFDLVLLGALIVAPLEAERHDPRWFVPALLAAAGCWLVVRLLVHVVSRYRLVSRAAAPEISEVSLTAARTGKPIEGVARPLDDSTDAHLIERRCLAASLTLEPEAEPGRVRLRALRSVPFCVETSDGRRIRVEGELRLAGEPAAEGSAGEALPHLGGEGLDPIWLQGATTREVLLQNKKRVSISGGATRAAKRIASGTRAGSSKGPRGAGSSKGQRGPINDVDEVRVGEAGNPVHVAVL